MRHHHTNCPITCHRFPMCGLITVERSYLCGAVGRASMASTEVCFFLDPQVLEITASWIFQHGGHNVTTTTSMYPVLMVLSSSIKELNRSSIVIEAVPLPCTASQWLPTLGDTLINRLLSLFRSACWTIARYLRSMKSHRRLVLINSNSRLKNILIVVLMPCRFCS